MSEFALDDIKRWIKLALEKDVSIYKAIYYDLYFACQHDEGKFNRATAYLERELLKALEGGCK